ncbi:YppE family protein [Alkalihalobacterium chitinilyticum]|uniref:YppE family protein n=1 Tax=Alkalihalobacterium chitinilyticum TaxID=2980103 RepID=A0ABT5V958_9BACI|nr:YppE family protein [Alkalihalobacterium chitinilyticum]MDE5411872.1 YppE family protein [Alkalihalobacterium chitinilyticum]
MTHEELNKLIELTKQLREFNDASRKQYTTYTIKEGFTADFYTDVKPFADRVFMTANPWKELAEQWVKEYRPKYVYTMQLSNAYDQLLETSVAAFQKDTKSKRFIDTIKSIDYLLDTVLIQIKQHNK